MTILRVLVQMELALLLTGLAGLAAWKIARRRTWRSATTGVARVQMWASCLVVVAIYLAGLPAALRSGSLPEVPGAALVLLGGSQALFLVAAAGSLRRHRTR